MTGGEAIYTDMGCLRLLPIRIAWFAAALLAPVRDHLEPAAQIARHPAARINLLYALALGWMHYRLDASLTGTWQAIQLGFLPRFDERHTTGGQEGRVCLRFVSWLLVAAALPALPTFRSQDALPDGG